MKRLIWILLVASCFGQMNIAFPSPRGGAAALHPKQKMMSKVLTGTWTNRFVEVYSHDGAPTSGEPATPILLAGNFRKMYVQLDGDPDSGGSSKGYTLTLRKNKTTNTAVTCTVLSSTANFQCAYTGSDVHVTASDTVAYQITAVSTPANTPGLSIIIEFEPDADDGSTVMMFSGGGSAVSSSDGQYFAFAGSAAGSATENTKFVVIPMDGTITLFGTNLGTVPGAGTSRTYTLRQTTGSGAGSGSNVGTAITYGAAANGLTTQAESISVTKGDRIDFIQNVSGSVASSQLAWGMVFKPTTTGQFILATSTSATSLSTTNATPSYITMSGGSGTSGTTESAQQQAATADFQLNGYSACLNVSPGTSPRDYTVTLEENAGAPSTTYSTALNAAGYCPVNSATTTYTIPTNYYLYNSKSVANATTPTAAKIAISYVGYIAP